MKKIVTLFLCLLCLMPIVKAEETYEAKIGDVKYATVAEAISAAKENEEVILLKDVSNITVSSDKNIKINLNKYTVNTITNDGTLLLNGNGTIDCSKYLATGITNNKDANLTIDNIVIKAEDEDENDLSTGIYNDGIITIKSGTFSMNDVVDRFLKNSENGKVTIENGTFTVEDLFYNKGELIINGGSFKKNSNLLSNENHGVITINGGTFNTSSYFIYNEYKGILTINNGTFSGESVACNSSREATITVNGGTFTTTSTTFQNFVGNDGNTSIKINGGNITSGSEAVSVLDSSYKNSIINITGGTIKGNNLISKKLVLGIDDDNVSTDLFKIDLGTGFIGEPEGIEEAIIEFYDGKIILGKKELGAGTVTIPEGYKIQYDDNGDNTYTAYLVKIEEDTPVIEEQPKEEDTPKVEEDPKEEDTPVIEEEPKDDVEEVVDNPPTGLYISLGVVGVLLVSVIGFITIKKKNYFSKI